ncbi:MAG: bifunctional methylenetetrahydrofolate dehydrogenase/methenyltetrahydrofolate cyclohydrolase FolD [Polyangia bacterium]|jgi:methylenetetrahydrofolate dehydrogenase (NADP+)/methenyltetrahydrofolate cyclohydrolase
MRALVLDGKALSKLVEESLKPRVAELETRTGRKPILATILVGEDPASATYVTMKGNACKRVGMDSMRLHLPADTTTTALMATIQELNANADVHGILLQHPVPKHIDERACFEAIEARKDVDGVSCLGFGRMAMGLPAYGSCTPAGIMHLLRHYDIALKGKRALVVGRSPILGKPMAAMLVNADATVMVAHSRSADLPALVGWAEVVVGAVGKPEMIKTAWLRQGTVVVDAGYHPGGIGDVERAGLAEKASAYTPVPGGVGPMTIATLIRQTVESAESLA